MLKGGSGANSNCAAYLRLEAGKQYRFCKLVIQGAARLIIPDSDQSDSPTRIWIEDNQQPTDGSSKCTSTVSNRLSVTAAGKIENETGDPTTLLIVGKGQKMRNNGTPDSSFYHLCFCSKYYSNSGDTSDPEDMMVWAPHYQVDVQRSTTLNGGVAAGRLYMRAKAAITWDENVANVGQDQLKIGLNYSPAAGLLEGVRQPGRRLCHLHRSGRHLLIRSRPPL